MSTDTDVQTAAATQLDEDGASSAVSPTLGAAVVLAKYPTLLLVVLAVGVLSRDIQPPLDYAIPDSSPAANSSAGGLSRNEIRIVARAAKDENNKAAATNRVYQIPNDERAKATSLELRLRRPGTRRMFTTFWCFVPEHTALPRASARSTNHFYITPYDTLNPIASH